MYCGRGHKHPSALLQLSKASVVLQRAQCHAWKQGLGGVGRVAVDVLPELPLSGQPIIWGVPLPGQAVPVRLPVQDVGAIAGVPSLGLWAAGTVPSLGAGPTQGASAHRGDVRLQGWQGDLSPAGTTPASGTGKSKHLLGRENRGSATIATALSSSLCYTVP